MKNTTLDCMKQMKLQGMASAYEAVLNLPVNQHPEPHLMLAQLLEAEQQHRSHKRSQMYLRMSRLRYPATIQDIYCREDRNLDKGTLMTLASCAFIERGENILITGATGCGKSYIACALGHHACLQGHRTLYFNINRFTEQITIAKTEGTLIKWFDRLKRAKLIILDDFGLQPITQAVRLILLQVLEDRYNKAATIICSQIPVAKWHHYFEDPTIADAILDRIVPNAHRIQLMGKSLRKSISSLS